VIARFHLGALSAAETGLYIQHRLAIAGLHGPIPFDARALKKIHAITAGVPRRINLLCARSLLGAWANGLKQVDSKVVKKAASEVFETGANVPGLMRSPHLALWVSAAGVVMLAMALGMYINRLYQKGPSTQAPTTKLPHSESNNDSNNAAKSLVADEASDKATDVKAPSAVVSATKPPTLEDLRVLWPTLARTQEAAMLDLLPLWNIARTSEDPCLAAAHAKAQCFRATDLTFPLLRQMGRPGILVLQGASPSPAYGLLVGLTETTATLQIEGTLHVISLTSLATMWQGGFITLWTPPAGYVSELREGSSGPLVSQLERQLAALEGNAVAVEPGKPPVLDQALASRVRTFQRSRGLKADGHPGPMTFMQLERALGNKEPSLQMGNF
jgi:general secretion pathway protein A